MVFVERGDVRRSLKLPCGQCIGCRLNRSRNWAVRCVHESQLHDSSWFLTLTYDDEHCPASLCYPHFQKFMKRLRFHVGKPLRFFMCGEYGDLNWRPHYHALVFGLVLDDLVEWSRSDTQVLFRSPLLEKLWPFGFSLVGAVTFESAAYVARYVVKKVNGDLADTHYLRVNERTGEEVRLDPEFARMSLKPGIGADWFRRFHSEVTVRDAVLLNGSFHTPPRYYYESMLKNMDGSLYDDLKFQRFEKAMRLAEDNTPQRLADRHQVALARSKLNKRSL